MDVALVGSMNVERDRTQSRVAGFLEDDCLGDVAQAEAAQLARRVRRQQSRGTRPGGELGAQVLARAMRGLARIPLERKHLVDDESSRSIAQVDELGREGEVHFAMIARSSEARCNRVSTTNL